MNPHLNISTSDVDILKYCGNADEHGPRTSILTTFVVRRCAGDRVGPLAHCLLQIRVLETLIESLETGRQVDLACP